MNRQQLTRTLRTISVGEYVVVPFGDARNLRMAGDRIRAYVRSGWGRFFRWSIRVGPDGKTMVVTKTSTRRLGE